MTFVTYAYTNPYIHDSVYVYSCMYFYIDIYRYIYMYVHVCSPSPPSIRRIRRSSGQSK